MLHFHIRTVIAGFIEVILSTTFLCYLFLTAIICYLQDSHYYWGGERQFYINTPQTAYSLAPQKLFITFKRKEWLKCGFHWWSFLKLLTAPPGHKTTQQNKIKMEFFWSEAEVYIFWGTLVNELLSLNMLNKENRWHDR